MMESLESIDVTKIKPPTAEEQKEFKYSVKEFIKINTKKNIRIDPFEFEKKAEQAELKYQAVIKKYFASIHYWSTCR